MNMGAYFHVAPRIKTCMLEESRSPPHQMPYAGRPPCASTATGFGKVLLSLPSLFPSIRTSFLQHR
jgi:2-oxoglutarate dehydrogenase E1 component